MKKTTKALLAIGAAVATPIIVNHVIAKNAQKRIVKRTYEDTFVWEYGDISYTVLGRETAPPMLLIHGIYPGASTLEWEAAMLHFSKTYRVYTLDLLGFGYSSKPALDYSGYLYVRLIKDFIEGVIGQPVIAAASLHAATALISCAALNPEDFDKLLLISPAGLENDTPLAQEEDGMMKKGLEAPVVGTSFYNAVCSKRGLTEFYRKESLADDGFLNNENIEKIYLAAHADGAGGKYAIAALVSKYFNIDAKDCLSRVTTPYHIILGEQFDQEAVFKIWQGLDEQYLADAITIEGAGLLPHMISPDTFCDAVRDLI